jgi:hypothetical protein
LAVFGLIVLAGASALAGGDAIQERMKKDITFLASDECQGRGIGTQGILKAADYIANNLKLAGLKPGGKDGTYFQPFNVSRGKGGAEVTGENKLTLRGPNNQTIELAMDKDFKVLQVSGSGKAEAPIVFAGYGLTVPKADYDDFKGLDVAGKIVIVLKRVPRWDNETAPFAGDKNLYAGFDRKIGNCEMNKAAAVIFVNDRSEGADGDKFTTVSGAYPADIPVVQVKREAIDTLLAAGKGSKLLDLEQAIGGDLKPRSGPVAGWSASITTNLTRNSIACKNILGTLEGSGPLANEIILIGAHYDHLGVKNTKMYPGADDNGSGTTTIMELSRRFGAMKDRVGRRLVFMLFSGEESGLLGSKHYCNREPLFPLENTATMVNIDMVGRLTEKDQVLTVEGDGSGKGLQAIIDKANEDIGFKFVRHNKEFFRSDQVSFYDKKIPVFFFFSGFHPDYHKPSDTADKINIAGMTKVATLVERILVKLTTEPKRQEYAEVPLPKKGGGGGFGKGANKGGAKLRLALDAKDDGATGVLVATVEKDGPADKAGIKPGDRITAIKGMPIQNQASYLAILGQQMPGVPLEMTLLRDGKDMKVTVMPE